MEEKEIEINVDLTKSEMDLILNALGSKPWVEVNAVMVKLINHLKERIG